MRLNFSAESAIILGGSCQIGLELIGLMREEGLRPVVTYATDAGEAVLNERFSDVERIRLDLSAPNAAKSLDAVLSQGVGYLIDLAHARHENLLAAQDMAQAAAYFQAHIAGRLTLLKSVTRSMLARRFGRLVHVSSTAAGKPAPGQGLYSASKNAAEALYQTLGLELGGRGVTSVNLRLGLVKAGRGKAFLDARREQNLPAVSVEQAAGTLLFLLSDQAQSLTCTTITMDAGLTARKY